MTEKKVEIACCNFTSCQNAEKAGASRIELFENLGDGGCTPSYGMMKLVKEKISIPVYAMIRPRGGDFTYSEEEFEIMKSDVKLCLDLAIDGIVFGILDRERKVDSPRCQILMDLWKNGRATFHRAFDLTNDLERSTEEVIDLGFERILTSGGESTATIGREKILSLHTKFNPKISIMAGSGISPNNVYLFNSLTEIHATCKVERTSNDLFGKYYESDVKIIEDLVANFTS